MESLYHESNKLVQETQHLFGQLEKKLANPTEEPAIEGEIEGRISTINSNCERLDILCTKGPISQRQNAKMRVDQLKYDSRHLAAALESWRNRRIRAKQEESEREALLSRRFTANDHVDITIDAGTRHNEALSRTTGGIDDLLQHGTGILESLRSQRMTLKGAQKRLIDIANTLGLSNTTMRFIERRGREDGFVLLAGIALTCLIMVLVVIYLI